MDFTDLANSIKEYFRPGSTAIQTAPGQTYGPSVSRITRTPINFRPLNGESGLYNDRYTSMLGQLIPGNRRQITIDPTSQDFQDTYKGNVQPVIQHEQAHAILEPALTDDQYEALADKNKQYQTLNNQIDRAGMKSAEVPAYASETGAAQRFGIPQNIVDLYRQQYVQQLQGINPTVAQMYLRNLGK